MKLLGVVVGTLFLMGCAATTPSSEIAIDSNANPNADVSSHMENQNPIDKDCGLPPIPTMFARW